MFSVAKRSKIEKIPESQLIEQQQQQQQQQNWLQLISWSWLAEIINAEHF